MFLGGSSAAQLAFSKFHGKGLGQIYFKNAIALLYSADRNVYVSCSSLESFTVRM